MSICFLVSDEKAAKDLTYDHKLADLAEKKAIQFDEAPGYSGGIHLVAQDKGPIFVSIPERVTPGMDYPRKTTLRAYSTDLETILGDVVLRSSIPAGGNVDASSLSIDARGRVLLAGRYQGQIDFGMGPLRPSHYSSIAAVVTAFDGSALSQGALWTRRFTAPRLYPSGIFPHVMAEAIAVSPYGVAVLGRVISETAARFADRPGETGDPLTAIPTDHTDRINSFVTFLKEAP